MNSSSKILLEAVSQAPDLRDMPQVALSPTEWKIVSNILQQHLPGRVVWAYGSRARGTRVKKYSDLDLAIEGAQLSLGEMGGLVEAFDESLLPFKVDIVEVDLLDPEFRRRIEADKVVLAVEE